MSEQPPRAEGDGEIAMRYDKDDYLCLSCETNGKRTMVRMSEFNAWRAFAMLASILSIHLPSKLRRAIKL